MSLWAHGSGKAARDEFEASCPLVFQVRGVLLDDRPRPELQMASPVEDPALSSNRLWGVLSLGALTARRFVGCTTTLRHLLGATEAIARRSGGESAAAISAPKFSAMNSIHMTAGDWSLYTVHCTSYVAVHADPRAMYPRSAAS